ncbi:MAG: hypothetical protein A3D92_05755, partial [Bacteroidetes bacterium RIFCSPHIGHO2_02_FULL_44_7]
MVLRQTSTFALLSLLLIFLNSCDRLNSIDGETGLSATGKVEEILVVCELGIWNDPDIRNQLDTNLTQWIMPYLPDVATFTLIHKTPSHFTQGVKRYRNTVFLTIDSKYKGEKGSIVRKDDVWAKGQLVIEITGRDFNQLMETCRHGLDEVHDQFDYMAWKRIMDNFEKYKNSSAREQVRTNFGIDIVLPEGAAAVTRRTNFYRIEFPPESRPLEFVGSGTQDAGAIFSGVMVYQYDYLDSNQFILKNLLLARDTMLKYNVPHETEGMYMGTQYNQFVYPECNVAFSADGKIQGLDVRGMFYFTGKPKHSTGGAFWAF